MGGLIGDEGYQPAASCFLYIDVPEMKPSLISVCRLRVTNSVTIVGPRPPRIPPDSERRQTRASEQLQVECGITPEGVWRDNGTTDVLNDIMSCLPFEFVVGFAPRDSAGCRSAGRREQAGGRPGAFVPHPTTDIEQTAILDGLGNRSSDSRPAYVEHLARQVERGGWLAGKRRPGLGGPVCRPSSDVLSTVAQRD